MMATTAGWLVAVAVLVGQGDTGRAITGTVVDPDGKPVAGAEVRLSCGMAADGTVPTLESTATDRHGRFRLAVPPRDRLEPLSWYGSVWAFRPGSALAVGSVRQMEEIDPQPLTLVLRRAAPRTLSVRDRDGRPVAGARVQLSAIHAPSTNISLHQLPDDLARRFAASTGGDGKVILADLSPRDDLMAVRIAVDGRGSRTFELTQRISSGKDAPAEYAIILNPPAPVAGRVIDGAGHPVAGVPVEIWTKDGRPWMTPTPVAFPGGAPRSAADGSFRAPGGLFAGSSYRVFVRAPGHEPIVSDWATAAEGAPRRPDLVLRPLRAIAGRVMDRRGRPVGGVEVFQTGDGPEATSVRTGDDGRFSLAGFRPGPVFLFARGDGFRFHGQLVNEGASQADLVLTRETEDPARAMATLPDPIPAEESRSLARKVLGPCLESALAHGNDGGKFWALETMVKIDPAAVQERLDSIRFQFPNNRDAVRNRIVIALAATDPEEAAAVAESIADPGTRAGVLVDLADALPASERARKLAALDQAALQARAATDTQNKLFQMGEVAERWYELGEIERARALFAEGRTVADGFANKSDPILGLFAMRLAHVDLPGALRIAEGIAVKERREEALSNIAARIAAENPAEAERVLNRIADPLGRIAGIWRGCQKMAAVDPARARRIAEQTRGADYRADALLFLAVGLKGRDRGAALAACRAAMLELDRYLAEKTASPVRGVSVAATLPLVEQVDPVLVPEVFWRAIATRPPIGDPRKATDYPSLRLVPFLARYDREVAAALFRPLLAEMQRADDPGLGRYSELLAWSLLDPRAAAARLAAIPPSGMPDANSNWTLTNVAECLALSGEARWKWIWRRTSGLGGVMFDRDVW
jgi:hypothetical protein